ncbi:contact-dependent growth inhibition system immunity protein [Achromobacter marplatensis]|jgi:hypothetical protein|uniref:Contact-dependent growth inhibition system immunity protein n=1 Tax=Achromobacter marplatensis TaxID=470868 RepID=A0AA42WIR6_9BURK|nr:contact-dependent growth inhibition system immunity protein [Achromobacter marplatensis]MDH2054986.1 contact-dependent growth inhibition system immunity protein [Achromobacter marplatensis]
MIDNNFEALSQLLGCYFHQDWPDEFESDTVALQAIIDCESKSQLVEAAKEIDFFLSLNLSEDAVRTILVDTIGCYYDPASRGIDYQQWLKVVREKFIGA